MSAGTLLSTFLLDSWLYSMAALFFIFQSPVVKRGKVCPSLVILKE